MDDAKETVSEDRKTRANWIIDKILLGICGVLLMLTYNNLIGKIDGVADTVGAIEDKLDLLNKEHNAMDRRILLLEYQQQNERTRKK